MATEGDAAAYLLPEPDSVRIFQQQIIGHPLLDGGVHRQAPVLLLVIGQPGWARPR